jgi:hypothetical protein
MELECPWESDMDVDLYKEPFEYTEEEKEQLKKWYPCSKCRLAFINVGYLPVWDDMKTCKRVTFEKEGDIVTTILCEKCNNWREEFGVAILKTEEVFTEHGKFEKIRDLF